ncbi:MAG TPA: hypothetical protein PKC24_03165 [Cyclobacteriaceae bacterium]|nr:hypothetical protein [Cyclobacteriaceae bacterium]
MSDKNEKLGYVAQAIALAKKIEYSSGLILAYSRIAEFNVAEWNDFNLANQYLDSALRFEKSAPSWVLKDLYRVKGTYHAQRGELDESYFWLIKALKNMGSTENERTAQVYWVQAYNALMLGKYEEAKHLIRKCIVIAEAHKNWFMVGAALNNLATVYSDRSQYDSALYYFKKLYQFELMHGNPFDNVILLGNLGKVYLAMGKPDSAYQFLLLGIASANKQNIDEANVGIFNSLASYHLQHHPDSAIYYSHKARGKDRQRDIYTMENITRTLAQAHAKMQQFDSAFYYQSMYLSYHDSVLNEKKLRQFTELEIQYGLEKKDVEIQNLQQAQELDKLKQRVLSIGLVTLIVFVIVLFFYFRLVMRTNKQELKVAHDRLADYLRKLLEKSELVEELNVQLQGLKEGKQADAIHIENLAQVVNASILTEEDWWEFKVIFERVHKGFFTELRNKFPDLTNAEVRLAALLKLQLSTREIAGMLGISPESVSKTRHRLRKKLNLPAAEDLQEFIVKVS